MAQNIPMPDEAQRKAFIDKLAQFRGSLSVDEKQILDVMVITTFAPRDEQADVQGYQLFWSQWGPAGPGWYTTGYLQPWTNNGYQQTAHGSAYGLQAGADGLYIR